MANSKSPTKIDEALTGKVAHLARLELSEQEIQTFTKQLADILGYVDQLQTVDVQGVEPLMRPIVLETPFREDEAIAAPKSPDGSPKILESAPEVLNGGYKVPPIL